MNPAHKTRLSKNPACAWVHRKPKRTLACGRMVNSVNDAVGLLWIGNWHVCQMAVETVLLGGTLWPLSELMVSPPASDETLEAT
ncbi:hypothetical protein SLEP1_g60463 [Rubroshorea leprosula]|uniref:Uncharacterized protein n=1 Tax=Rubroshorea leprosula TaxID=152421 RepID=A0AAV5MZH7_9ROSI|nr:hypothetical protein SLEP1_g60463 [Rubroshorea leprosula]